MNQLPLLDQMVPQVLILLFVQKDQMALQVLMVLGVHLGLFHQLGPALPLILALPVHLGYLLGQLGQLDLLPHVLPVVQPCQVGLV